MMALIRSLRTRGARLASFATSLAFAWVGLVAPVLAQDGDPSTGFRSVTGPSEEDVPGGLLLVAAYAVIWVLVFGYVLRLGKLQAATRAEIERVSKSLDR